jgi:hypothetical protein
MGIIDWLKTAEGSFAIGAVIGYVGGNWLKKKLTEYSENISDKIVERMKQRESYKEAVDIETIYKSFEERLKKIEEKLAQVPNK